MRSAVIDRQTAETDIHCQLNLDGSGHCQVSTGIGFFDHMMNLFAFHGGFDLVLEADGDLDVDDHHTIEDCGIALGQAFKKALGERTGIERYGFFLLPMDESLAEISLDISGRPYLVFNCEFSRDQIGMMATEMVEVPVSTSSPLQTLHRQAIVTPTLPNVLTECSSDVTRQTQRMGR